jgi:hypothetical protein
MDNEEELQNEVRASGSFTLKRTGSTSTYITTKCNWSSKSNGPTANTSTVTITVVASKSSSSTASTYGSQTTSCTVDGTKQSNTSSFTLAPGKSVTLLSKTYTVKHNDNGTKSCVISVDVGGNIIYFNGSATVTLDTIPRYATSVQKLAGKTETSITMDWSSDNTIDYIWYSTNNGSSWTGVNVTDGKSGTYTITGLKANTAYNVKTRVRRKDNQLTTDSSALAVTTYNYPYANSTPNFTIGNKFTIGLYNPLNRSVTVNILGADNSQCTNDTTTGTSITGYNGTTVVNRFYASIPNAKSGTYKVKVTYGSQVTTTTGGTYSINTNICTPTIGTISYKDTNTTTTGITENNQLIISQQSKVQFTATNLAAVNSATVKTCKLSLNGNTYNMSISGSTATISNVTIDSGMNLTGTITVTDSRGLTASKNVTVTMLDWVLPSAIITLQRQNNFYSETDINVNADYSSINGKNTITIKVRYKKVTDSSYGAYTDLSDGVTSVLTLDNLYEWNVQVVVTDLFGSTTYNLTVGIGLPIIFFDRLLHSTGFNCFPIDEKSVEVNGVNIERSVATVSLSAAITNLAVNTYTIIPFDLSNVAGSKLTATSDGGIKIGAGVTKVLVSGMISYDTITATGSKHLRIIKNSYSAANTLSWSWQTLVQSQPGNVEAMPIVADVQEGDVIYMIYYTGSTTDKIGGNTYGGRTSLTVEVIE